MDRGCCWLGGLDSKHGVVQVRCSAACSAAAVESGPDLAEVAQHRQRKGSDSGHREEMV
jgi:hypothetical protein